MNSDLYPIGNIIEVQPRRHKFKTNEYQASGSIPIIDQSTDFIAGFTDETDRAYDGELPVIIFGDHTCCLKFIDFRFAVGADGTQLLRPVKGIDARYLYYALHAVDLKQFGYQRHFKLLKDCEVRVPSLEIQRRIALILGAYDDLIEVNRRRIAVLEEMARELFEEWFVRFRFPDHETVPILDAQDGPLPEGWRLVNVGAVLRKFRRPVKIMKQEYEQGGIIPCIDQGADFIGGYTNNSDALITSPLPLCVFGDHTRVLKFITFPFASGADGTQLLYPVDDLTPEFLYFSLLNVDLSNQHYARHFKFLKEQEICLPTAELIERFTMVVKPQMELVKNIRFQNQKLSASRDLLLPRLISGQLSVAEAERELEEVA